MNTPGPRRLGRREVGPGVVDERTPTAEAEQRRLAATVARLRLELARLRGELDDDDDAPGVTRHLAGVAETDAEQGDLAAEADARARDAEHRVRLLAEELGAERRDLDRLRGRLADVEAAGGRNDALVSALAEEREARIMLETLRDGLQAAMEEQRTRHQREVADVVEAAEDRRVELSQSHLREQEQLRAELDAAGAECGALAERLEAEAGARARAEARGRDLDREVDELRNWISAAQSRRLSLLRRSPLPPRPGRIPPSDRRMTPPPTL
jgi:chromosome segregation ATPase